MPYRSAGLRHVDSARDCPKAVLIGAVRILAAFVVVLGPSTYVVITGAANVRRMRWPRARALR